MKLPGWQLDSQPGVDAVGASPSAPGLEAPVAAALGEQAPALSNLYDNAIPSSLFARNACYFSSFRIQFSRDISA